MGLNGADFFAHDVLWLCDVDSHGRNRGKFVFDRFCLGALMARDGLMMPFGPLAMAEGEMRKLHELLWRLWNERDGRADGEKAGIAGFVLEAAITRVAGFCHMTETGAVLRDGIECLGAGEPPLEAVLEELVLYSGRIAASLDLRIQWWGMNEITLGAREGR